MNPVAVVGVLSFLIGIFTGTWKPFAGLKEGPQTAQVRQLQAQVATVQAEAKQAVQDEKNARAKERGTLEAQVRSAQEDTVMAGAAIKAVPEPAKTQAVRIAEAMIMRTDFKLATAIGDLPAANRASLMQAVADALNGQQAKFDAETAKRDADFKALTEQREKDRVLIAETIAKTVAVEAKLEKVQGQYTESVNSVSTWADKARASELKAGSFFGAFSSMRHWAYGLGIAAICIGAFALYLRRGLGSVGRALHPLKSVLPEAEYAKVIGTLDSETDTLHQWLISGGRKSAAAATATNTPHP